MAVLEKMCSKPVTTKLIIVSTILTLSVGLSFGIAVCGGIITSPDGSITSPGFPDAYAPNQFCVWEIITSPKNRIKLNFRHLDIENDEQKRTVVTPYYLNSEEDDLKQTTVAVGWINSEENEEEKDDDCVSDKLEISSIIDGNKTKLHGVYCGNELPDSLVSESNTLKIVFRSDSSVEKTGFSLNYSTVLNKCAVNNGNCRHTCSHTLHNFQCVCNRTFVSLNNGRDCKRGECRYEISSSSGKITYPNRARKYCQWYFTTTPGHRIKLTFSVYGFNQFGSHCSGSSSGYIMFSDGFSSNASVIQKICTDAHSTSIFSSRHELLINFQSAGSQRLTFNADYMSVCGGTLQADLMQENYIYSHADFGLDNYQSEIRCTWRIEVLGGLKLNLMFTFFDLEGMDCSYDFVEIVSEKEVKSFGRFCGNILPPNITAFDTVLVQFQSDDIISKRGFSLVYKAEVPDEFVGLYNRIE